MDRWVEGWMDGWVDGQTGSTAEVLMRTCLPILHLNCRNVNYHLSSPHQVPSNTLMNTTQTCSCM